MKNPPLFPIYPIATLRDLLLEAARRYQDRVALRSKKNGAYRSLTYLELKERAEELATAFFDLGLHKGDRVALLSENRTEWAVTYLAAVSSGLVALPVDKDLKPGEISHILNYAEAKILVCSSEYLDQFRDNRSAVRSVEKLISMEESTADADLCFPEVLESGGRLLRRGARGYETTRLEPQDLAAIIFTSGTTGNSKGVMLSHANIVSNVVATSQFVAINNQDVVLSVLPLHHTYECTCGFLTALYQGCAICHAENLRRIPDNLLETRATVMLGVPLLFETIYRRIESGIREKGEGKFRLAKGIASLSEKLLRINLRRRIFKPLHDKFGGRLRLLISGGAAINPAVSKGFRELGIDFIQGYGMTEASPIIAVNRVNCFKDAAAGLPLPGVTVKIVDGEIVVRGPNVMGGYYLNESATQEALKEGWLYTGDLGCFDQDGFLYISGRKKSVIVTPNGKNVYPEEIEAVLNQSPYILESLVWGGPEEDPSQVEVQAIVVPRTEIFDQDFGPRGYDEARIHQVIAAEVKRCNENLALYKRVRKFTLRHQEFEKTTTRKIKRFLYTGKPSPITTG